MYGWCIALTILYKWPSTNKKVSSRIWAIFWLLDLPEHVILTFPCELIHSFKVVINRMTCCYAKILVGGNSFVKKVRIRSMLSRIYIWEHAVYKDCYEIFIKTKVCDGACIFKTSWIHSFTIALKTHFLLFKKDFQAKLK